MSDPRFQRLKSDPRFRHLKRHKNKIVVDDRFKSVFSGGKKQNELGRVDKYGRPVSDSKENESLRRFYRLDTEDQRELPTGLDYARGEVLLESSDEEDGSAPDDVQTDEEDGAITLGQDARRPIPVPEDEGAEVDLNEEDFADLDAQAASYAKANPEDEPDDAPRTRRIAVVNLDWDYVRAAHLYKIFSSATSPAKSSVSKTAPIVRGKVLNVRIYPSKFGLERMAREENGPPTDLFKRKAPVDEEDINERTIYETGDADEYDEEALRRYQLERLRYYYAVVECDSVQIASHLYSELQGAELERSANLLDLSFVPDDMTFDEKCRDEATCADEGTNYQGLDFTTDALRHSKVKLTWDQDDPERDRITRRALSLKEIEDNDFRAYVASSSESSSEDEQESTKKNMDREKLRALLLGGGGNDLPEGWAGTKYDDVDKDDDDVDMEVTFRPALSGEQDPDETTLGKYQRKMRDKRKKRMQELKEKAEDKRSADDFFARSEDDGSSDGDLVQARRKAGKGGRPSENKIPSTEKELSLLVAADKHDSEPKHFDMAAIIKAEKNNRKKRKRSKKNARGDDDNELQDDFAIDVKDERFKAVHEEHAFAIDPSNPRFKKTKSMSALLAERSKRKTGRDGSQAKEKTLQAGKMQNLKSLVENVRRRGANAGANDSKRRKL
ncbi:hypothetical protein BC834DRAFT_849735 [Gloeopeniophorella convolvens]|nr:hypothetical protein BC834DRAFT_849735 [Gloeopeniophorella convolvens]